jgi:RimJ/RimL family protein N-acetyltransferase
MRAHDLTVVPAVTKSPGPTAVGIRAIRSTDVPELRRFYAELSPDSRRSRFLSVCPGVSQSQSTLFCTTDHDHQEGFVAVVRGTGGERIVGHLCLEPDGDDVAEVAIAVADTFQQQGIGRRLLAAGASWSRSARVARLTATMFTANAPIHHLLTAMGLPTRMTDMGAGVSRITIDLRAMTAAA